MTVNFYQMIESKVRYGDLKLICIISPARVGSTLFMNVLAQSPSVHGFINQPFHLTYSFPYVPPDNREEIAYQRIWEKYLEARKIHSQKVIVLVIKCMARNLGIGQQIVRLLKLIDKPILLIRNPFLSIESLLKMQVMSIEDMPEASQNDLDFYALQKGFMDKKGDRNHWQVLRNFILETKNYRLISDLLIETLAFIELNQYEMNMINDYQYYFDSDCDENRNNFFALSWTGWYNMAVIYKHYISTALDYLVIDSTILRCTPEKVCSEVSYALKIEYTSHMVNDWQVVEENIIDDTVIKTSWMKNCYNGVTNSSGVRPPEESPVSIQLLPNIFQDHVLNTAYPAYLALFKDSHTIRPHSYEEIQKLLNQTVTKYGNTMKQVDQIFAEVILATFY